MKRKLGINCECISAFSQTETLSIIKDVGFDNFFAETYDLRLCSALKNKAEQLGLHFEFIHSPYKRVNELWLDGEEYRPLFEGILQSIDCANESDARIVIVHVSSGWNPPCVNDLGLSRYDKIVEYAEKKNVVIAFENLRKFGNLACLMDRYENVKNVGFCYDCGHELCYTETVPFLDIYGTRTVCTHLHDNCGRSKIDPWQNNDQHLLPFDGVADYKTMIEKMNKYGYSGALTLEIFNKSRPDYAEMSPENFIRTAFERLKKISLL
ncbi:MAG: sugar phosphate isomerase/epimerase [Clostridia bacterium]|nr:sugar phosphate isomerase/epimerase [Clostridia bacterium]